MSNQDLLFIDLNTNESDAIKGGKGFRRKHFNKNFNNYKKSFNTVNTQSFSVSGDVIVGNGSNIGNNSPINIGNFG